MAKERKKVKSKQAPQITPKKRIVKKTGSERVKKEKEVEDTTPTRQTVKYIRLAEDASKEEKIEMADRVHKNEIKWVYYAIDGNKGYFYYSQNKRT